MDKEVKPVEIIIMSIVLVIGCFLIYKWHSTPVPERPTRKQRAIELEALHNEGKFRGYKVDDWRQE